MFSSLEINLTPSARLPDLNDQQKSLEKTQDSTKQGTFDK